jgi:hypothetical protein
LPFRSSTPPPQKYSALFSSWSASRLQAPIYQYQKSDNFAFRPQNNDFIPVQNSASNIRQGHHFVEQSTHRTHRPVPQCQAHLATLLPFHTEENIFLGTSYQSPAQPVPQWTHSL